MPDSSVDVKDLTNIQIESLIKRQITVKINLKKLLSSVKRLLIRKCDTK